MNKKDFIHKITSRKFIVTIITAAAGLITLFCGHESEVNTIAGALMTIIPAIVYCIMEGTVDAAHVREIGDAAKDAAKELGKDDVANLIEDATDVAEDVVDIVNPEKDNKKDKE